MYLLNILESIEKILLYSRDCNTAEEFYELNDQLNFNASLSLFANIGENISKISNELKQAYCDIDWNQIRGFRNRVVHDYVNIDTLMVFDIIRNDLLPLKSSLIKIVASQLNNGNFDNEEYEEARNSFYYRHVDFETIKS
jgi:uncharacterized protein with HEPN domain